MTTSVLCGIKLDTNDLEKLRSAIIDNTRVAFRELATRVKSETLYGFALYSDDSLNGVDAAVNTLEHYNRAITRPRANRFESYWYTISWGFEGGVAEYFENTNAILSSFSSRLAHDVFRLRVLDVFLNAMSNLSDEGFFNEFNTAEERLFQISITDSEDDEMISERSIRELNPQSVWKRYLNEKEAVGY